MSEYIIDWDENLVIDTFSKNSLREEIVRCRNCKFYRPREGATLNCRFEHPSMPNTVEWCIAEPDGFCAWGERANFATCECGEDIELGNRESAVCPRCNRTVRA